MRRSRVGEIQDKFWGRVEVLGPDECWRWVGTNGPDGYGYIAGKLNGERLVPAGKAMLAHRVSWIMANGPIPDAVEAGYHGWVVMHTCDNRKCVNPAHLRLGRQAENVADMDNKERRVTVVKAGAKHARAKLTPEQVAEILASDEEHKVLAARFGVSIGPIKNVRLGKSYREETGGAKRMRDRFRASGESNPKAALTYEQVKFIRESPLSGRELARQLGLSQVCVASARRGATYANVDVPIPPPRVGRMRKPT